MFHYLQLTFTIGFSMENELGKNYWDNRYQQNEIAWDIGAISTPLKEYFDQITNKSISILIPGCGNAYEAAYLLQIGFTNITLADISPVVTAQVTVQLKEYVGKQLNIITGNFFELDQTFDLIIEQTFFCALNPTLREKYVLKIKALLKPGGKLAGVLFNRTFAGGPPFGGNNEEYKSLFSKHFQKLQLAPCYNSIAPRMGSELFIIAHN